MASVDYQKRVDIARRYVNSKVPVAATIVPGAVDSFAEKIASSDNNIVADYIVTAYLNDIERYRELDAKRPNVRITVALTTDRQAKMRNMFRELKLEMNVHGTPSNHAIGAAVRQVFTSLTHHATGFDTKVIDIGGQFSERVHRGHLNVHSCCLKDNVRDCARYINNELRIKNSLHNSCIRLDRNVKQLSGLTKGQVNNGNSNSSMSDTSDDEQTLNKKIDKLKARIEAYRKFDCSFGMQQLKQRENFGIEYRCYKDARDCDVQATAGVCVDSGYDISMEAMGQIMDRHGLKVVHGFMIFSPDILKTAEGVIDNMELTYKIDYDKDTIDFIFVDDPSFYYTHKWSNYKEYMFPNQVVTSNNVYSYWPGTKYNGVLQYEFRRMEKYIPQTDPYYIHHIGVDVKRITAYNINYNYDINDPRAFERFEAICPDDTYQNLVKICDLNIQKPDFTRDKFHNYARAVKSAFIINGRAIYDNNRIETNLFESLVTSIFAQRCRKAFINRHSMNLQMTDVNFRRNRYNLSTILNVIRDRWFMPIYNKFKFSTVGDLEREFIELRLDHRNKFIDVIDYFPVESFRIKTFYTDISAWISTLGINSNNDNDEPRDNKYDSDFDAYEFINTIKMDKEQLQLIIDNSDDDNLVTYAQNMLIDSTADFNNTDNDDDDHINQKSNMNNNNNNGLSNGNCLNNLVNGNNNNNNNNKSEITENEYDNDLAIDYADAKFEGENAIKSSQIRRDKGKRVDKIQNTVCEQIKYIDDDIARKVENEMLESCNTDTVRATLLSLRQPSDKFNKYYNQSQITIQQRRAEVLSSIDEARRYNTYLSTVLFNYVKNHCVKQGSKPNKQYCRTHNADGMGFNWLFFSRGKYTHSLISSGKTYMVGFDPIAGKFINIRYDKADAIINSNCAYLFVTDSLQIFTNKAIGVRLKNVLDAIGNNDDFLLPKFVLHDGVPGCGKTTGILNALGADDLMICVGRETAKRARKKAVSMGIMTVKQAKLRIRTADSFIMNPNVTAKRVYFDEVFMVHEGIAHAVAILANADEIHASGDPMQIPFINRDRSFITRFSRLRRYDTIEKNYVSFSVPAIMTSYVSEKYYDGKMRTTNTIVDRDAVNFHRISSFKSVPKINFDNERVYLTHTQKDKTTLIENGYQHVMTIHESEGERFDEVNLVRLAAHASFIYDKPEHEDVCLTRCRKRFNYYSVYDGKDIIREAISHMKREAPNAHKYIIKNDPNVIDAYNKSHPITENSVIS